MRVRSLFLAAAFFLVTLVFPRPSLAESIGVSPGEMDVVVYRGDRLEETLTLSRAETAADIAFEVSEPAHNLAADLRGQTAAVIPAGQGFVPFVFDVDATDLSVGEYDGSIEFLVRSADSGPGQKINTGLVVSLHVSVQERPDPLVGLSVADYPTLMREISFSTPSVVQAAVSGGRRMRVSWNILNHGTNPLGNIESHVVISKNGSPRNSQTFQISDFVRANDQSAQSYDFLLDATAPSGWYVATVTVGGESKSVSFWVVQPLLRAQLEVLLIGALGCLIVLFAWVLSDRRRSERGKRRA